MFNPQQKKIYQLLEERAGLGVACFEFATLLHITQQNARLKEIREKLGCTCINTRGSIKWDCKAKEHITNNGGTTFLVRPNTYQPSFL
jgi:hypothetical protein